MSNFTRSENKIPSKRLDNPDSAAKYAHDDLVQQKKLKFDTLKNSLNLFRDSTDPIAKNNVILQILTYKDGDSDLKILLANDEFFTLIFHTAFDDFGSEELSTNSFNLLIRFIQKFSWSFPFIIGKQFHRHAYELLSQEDCMINHSILCKFLANVMAINTELLHDLFTSDFFYYLLSILQNQKLQHSNKIWVLEVLQDIFSINFYDINDYIDDILQLATEILKDNETMPKYTIINLVFDILANLLRSNISQEQKAKLINPFIWNLSFGCYDSNNPQLCPASVRYLINAVYEFNEYGDILVNESSQEVFNVISSLQNASDPEIAVNIILLINNIMASSQNSIDFIWKSEFYKLIANYLEDSSYKVKKQAIIFICRLMMLATPQQIPDLLENAPLNLICDDFVYDENEIVANILGALINLTSQIVGDSSNFPDIKDIFEEYAVIDRLEEIISQKEKEIVQAATFLLETIKIILSQ